VVTISVDGVEFHAPVEIGNLLTLKSRVNYVGESSMIVGIRVESTDIKTVMIKHTNTAFFTMVMTDSPNNKSVPGLILETEEDIRRFAEGLYLRDLGREKRKTLRGDMSDKTTNQLIELLKDQRFKVS
jgi:acyl-CoA hydrolase